MPTHVRKRAIVLDPVRQLIVDKAKEKGVSQGSISEHLGKNRAWMNQFILRASPKTLDSDERKAIAELLDLEPEQLILPEPPRKYSAARPPQISHAPDDARENTPPLLARARTRLPEEAVLAEVAQETRRIAAQASAPGEKVGGDARHFHDTDTIPASIIEGRGTFTLYVTSARSRLRPGDEITATGAVPARIGDLVAVIKDGRVVSMGELSSATREHWTIVEHELEIPGGTERDPILRRKCDRFAREGARLFKIINARFG